MIRRRANAFPLNTWRNNNVVITSKRRHFDVITSKWRRFDVIATLLLRNVFAGLLDFCVRNPVTGCLTIKSRNQSMEATKPKRTINRYDGVIITYIQMTCWCNLDIIINLIALTVKEMVVHWVWNLSPIRYAQGFVLILFCLGFTISPLWFHFIC